MKRKFNVTGICVPNMHYMVDISEIAQRIRFYTNGYPYLVSRICWLIELAGYLKSKNKDRGYLLTFDFRKKRDDRLIDCQWVDWDSKRIFDVILNVWTLLKCRDVAKLRLYNSLEEKTLN